MEYNCKIYNFDGELGEDFQLWSARAEAVLEDKQAWSPFAEVVVGNAPEPFGEDISKATAKSKATIMQGLGDNPLRVCLHERNNPYRMLKILNDRYVVVNVALTVQVQYQLSWLVYGNQKMTSFVDQFQTIFNRLAGINSAIPQDMQVANLLAISGDKSKLPFGHVVEALW